MLPLNKLGERERTCTVIILERRRVAPYKRPVHVSLTLNLREGTDRLEQPVSAVVGDVEAAAGAAA